MYLTDKSLSCRNFRKSRKKTTTTTKSCKESLLAGSGKVQDGALSSLNVDGRADMRTGTAHLLVRVAVGQNERNRVHHGPEHSEGDGVDEEDDDVAGEG